ncbi:hypothetical protein CAOG_03945 [Capsaspora owczarzaki ATCC 30864]|uniref:Uncharacterized protein n=1 Tax=Capsaspora owczarzaki (strain ATCC 30864) TaxID=595528 RepID=A0A0D2VQV0_CAPO3|nr:hypothetical protein CAOG_03945 [Capsaspora owczarzaki ATCC 30864]KJE93107.1 hypothetical protein CAOG_003945 [Capsaspora owczarzaki ATCC 30864]|eukprot:XP_004363673.1 hypothetical protein CAOG_03945 [Capsaspora owczarzaki ATCC 30864]
MAQAAVGPPHNPNNDLEMANAPDDSVSSMRFCPSDTLDYLVVGAWDQTTRVYNVDPMSGQSEQKMVFPMDAPVLDVAWHADCSKVFAAGCNKQTHMFDLGTGQSMPVAMHDQPIKTIRYLTEPGLLMSCGWDRMVKFWDLRSPNCINQLQLAERVYAADAVYPMAVVATADRHVNLIDLRQPSADWRQETSLKYQTRCVAVFPQANGYAIGSIEGRVAVNYPEFAADDKRNFSFKCHRLNEGRLNDGQTRDDVYAVNSIVFHPTYGTFATTGSDGCFFFWDKDSRQRLKPFNRANQPIPCSSFNGAGNVFAYAVSYDWSRGIDGASNQRPHLLLHSVRPDEIRPKPAPAAQPPSYLKSGGRR